ncbi:autotransporter outer membrane beta-barrel domain-containing protein, partial [Candidatus Synechococcus spongiarum]|uniref:autotransporter outer membrane beta-barrel domain-containing protein n=1 Tax=Candidatus Synechococcus spongiarum TaxID=431041 RepID=UPI001F2EFEA7
LRMTTRPGWCSRPVPAVEEGSSGSYTVKLASEPTGTVTVRVGGNNSEVTVSPASLSFTATTWNTAQPVTVSAGEDDDATNDSATLSHTAAGGGYNSVTGNVAVTITDNDIPTDVLTEAVKAGQVRVGRTVAQQVVNAVQGRFSANPQAGLTLTMAGEELTGARPLAENAGALSKVLGFESVSGQQLAQGSSFSFSPRIAAGQGVEEGATPRLSLWGEGALSSFRGQEATLSLNGDVTTALVGADWRTERWLAGAALSHSWGNGGYAGEDGNDADLSATMTGLFPYGRYALTPRLGVWAVAGYGRGKLSVTPDGAEREYRPGSTMVMGAVGLDGLLLDGGAEGLSLTTTIDLLSQKTTTEQVDALSSSEGSVSRLRVGLEAVRPFPLANGSSLLPSLEVGIRHDGGDAESGFGLEVGAALAWNDPQRGISAQVKGRSLVTHMAEEFREQSLALSFAWEPSPTNRGPSLALGHTMGAPASGMDALLNPAGMEGLDDASSGGQQFEAQLAYGFPAFNDRLTMTPGVAVALSPTSSAYTLLWSLAPYSQQSQTPPWEIALEGTRQQTNSATSPVDHSLKLDFSLPF